MSEPTDPEGHNAAEDLDEDRLRLDPLEAGMDPPERWSPAIDHDDAEPRDLEERLREEEPESDGRRPAPRDELERMEGSALRDDVEHLDAEGELSGSPTDDEGDVVFTRDFADLPEEARNGRMADEGAGSVARDLRTPRPAE